MDDSAKDETCEVCGASTVDTRVLKQEFVYGSGTDAVTLSVKVPVTECSTCEMAYSGEEGEVIRDEAVRRHLQSLRAV